MAAEQPSRRAADRASRGARARPAAPPSFTRPASLSSGLRRSALFTCGVLLGSFCYAVTIRSGLGLGPLFVLQDGISLHTGMTIGDAVMVTGVGCVLGALCLRTVPGPGTVCYPFVSGLFLNWVLPRLPTIHGLGFRLAAVVLATFAMALGGACAFRAALGVSAYDSIMLGLHRMTGRPLAPLRLGMELTVLLAGWALGGAVGVGTVITGLCIGPGMQFWIRVLGGIPTAAQSSRSRTSLRHPPARLGAVVEPASLEAATFGAAGIDPDERRAGPVR